MPSAFGYVLSYFRTHYFLVTDARPHPFLLRTRRCSKWLGGIDFGTRNLFAAVWDFFDPSGVFWPSGELYERGKPLSDYFRPPAPPGIVAGGGEDLRFST